MLNCNQSLTPLEIKLRFKQKEGIKRDLTLYSSLMGSLRYLTHMRPNLLFSMSFLSKYMENPTFEHLKCVKRTLRYINLWTLDFRLKYRKGKIFDLKGYYDSDYGRDSKERKSTSWFIVFLTQ